MLQLDNSIGVEDGLILDANTGGHEDTRVSIMALEETIEEKRSLISNAHKGADQLTELLHTFLGRNEIVFRSDDKGYQIFRGGKRAQRLSEGEYTAIAFIYFIVQLRDRDFHIPEGVVVIDDPISSLDASSVYQAFGFLKTAVKDAKQVILLTHNFGFLRLLLNWMNHIPKREGAKCYYMLVCRSNGTGRSSEITKLDRALVEHATEYHYLFKILATFQSDGTISGCYHIPNIVRKVLETFLDFYAPGKKELYQKLGSVSFDENKKAAIYKFANDLSHFTGQGFEPGLVQESQKNALYLLEMIKELAPKHYAGMLEAVTEESG